MTVRDYRIPFMPEGVFSHHVRGDILAGHLCWYFAQADGATGAQRLIQAANDGAFRLSDVFPEGFLPLPVDNPQVCLKEWLVAEEAFNQVAQKHGDKEAKCAKSNWHAIRKRARKLTHLDARYWRTSVSRPGLLRQIVEGQISVAALLPRLQLPWSPPESAENKLTEGWNGLHTAINRISNGALSGSLHERMGIQYRPGSRLDLYLRCDEGELNRYVSALEQIGLDGHLKHASTGWGRFTLSQAEPCKMMTTDAPSSRWVTLSPCVPEEDYGGDICCKLQPHYGKLGGVQTVGGVYKRPVILLATGASFIGAAPRGCWLRNVHSTQPEVVHYAFAYPLAC
ncbi:MAG: hypothetical protein V1899_05070 [Planctomycetota bacterium]